MIQTFEFVSVAWLCISDYVKASCTLTPPAKLDSSQRKLKQTHELTLDEPDPSSNRSVPWTIKPSTVALYVMIPTTMLIIVVIITVYVKRRRKQHGE